LIQISDILFKTMIFAKKYSEMTVSIIVAVAKNKAIGKDNQLLWRLSDDLKNFKKVTSGHAVIMGRKTYDSLGKPLPNRRNVVITRQKDLKIGGVEIVNSLESALELFENSDEEIFILGGAEIYKLAGKYANKIYLTMVEAAPEADAFFDFVPYLSWNLISQTAFQKNEKNEFDFEVMEFSKN